MWDTAYSTVLTSRKMGAWNEVTRQVLSQVRLEQATKPDALTVEDTPRSKGSG
jgi:hypothetical protein